MLQKQKNRQGKRKRWKKNKLLLLMQLIKTYCFLMYVVEENCLFWYMCNLYISGNTICPSMIIEQKLFPGLKKKNIILR